MTQNYNYDWAYVLRDCSLDYRLDGEKNYKVCLGLIREVGDGFFDVTGKL